MPKIAQYTPNQVQSQVTSQPLAQDAPAAAFGGDIAKGLGDVAQAGLDMKKRIDTTSAEEAMVQFERDKNDVFFNPESGYFNSQGRDAYDGSAATTKAMEDLRKKYGDTLNPESKLMFNRTADAHITRSNTDIARHASKGLKAWEITTIEAQVENSLENATLYWGDPERLKVQRILGRQGVIDSADMAGIGAEAKAEKLQTFESSFADATIVAAITSSAAEGQAALDEYGDRLEGPDKLKLETAIEKKTKTEKTQSDATTAVLVANGLVDRYDSKTEIVAEVKKIEDTELREKTMAEAMSQYSTKQAAEKEQSTNNYQTAIGEVNNGKTPIQIQAENAEAWEGMTDSQRNNILAGKHMITDQALFNQLRLMPTKQKAELDPNDYADKLKPADLQKLTTEINAAKKGQPGSRVKSLISKSNEAAEGMFGRSSKWKTSAGKVTARGKKANQFLNDMQEAVTEFETDNQRKITPVEENKLISEFTRGILVEKSAFGIDWLEPDVQLDLKNTPAKDMRVLNKIIDATPDIDQPDLVAAYQFLVDNDQPITPNSLKSAYKQGRQ